MTVYDYCPGCTHFTNNVVDLAALADAGVSWATVSNMPLAQIEACQARMGDSFRTCEQPAAARQQALAADSSS